MTSKKKVEFISDEKQIEKITPKQYEYYYGKGGNEVEESDCLIKVIASGDWEKYFIWTQRGSIFNPYGDTLYRKLDTFSKFVLVKKEIFQHYLKFLKTKNLTYYNMARRSYSDNKGNQ